MITKCERCGKIIEKPRKSKRFCSTLCQTRELAHISYLKNGNKKWYKDRQKKMFKKWRLKNREHFNDLVREPNRLYQRKKRKIYRKLGLCERCGGIKERQDRINCNKCRKKDRGNYEKKNRFTR